MLLESSLTGTTFEQSFSGRKNNPYLLQESEEQASKEVNSNAYINVESNIVDKDNNAMIISIEEEHKTLEYQEKMKLDIGNISKNRKIWIPIYEVIDTSFFAETNFPP